MILVVLLLFEEKYFDVLFLKIHKMLDIHRLQSICALLVDAANPDISMCFHRFAILAEATRALLGSLGGSNALANCALLATFLGSIHEAIMHRIQKH
jgi:hypothetical protein